MASWLESEAVMLHWTCSSQEEWCSWHR